ncbi:hypothetical protein [Mucilaginibacter sp.]|uniref:hypothetical protein n=1 Tax=Mucilaginibacter sp. TaxID=1882438 RepID=UPI0028487C98|nr:hypothetical protein [Mucilaginibacter sp.]MDR3694553.1 hypothetical protein [Mucilaginibacter sp.]
MKKIITILGCVILLAVSSCTKQYVSPATTNQTLYADLTSSNWTPYTDNNGSKSYTASINVKALDPNFTAIGGVIVAISYDGGTTYEQVPETYANVAYSFTYNAGNISLYAQSADGSTPVQPTLPIKVKIILVDSNS